MTLGSRDGNHYSPTLFQLSYRRLSSKKSWINIACFKRGLTLIFRKAGRGGQGKGGEARASVLRPSLRMLWPWAVSLSSATLIHALSVPLNNHDTVEAVQPSRACVLGWSAPPQLPGRGGLQDVLHVAEVRTASPPHMAFLTCEVACDCACVEHRALPC